MGQRFSFAMEDIPDEILTLIFSYLTPKELGTLSCACRRWKKLALDDRLWFKFCLGSLPSQTDPTEYLRLHNIPSFRVFYLSQVNFWDPAHSAFLPESSFSSDYRKFTARTSGSKASAPPSNEVLFAERGFLEGIHYWEVIVHQLKATDMLVGVTVSRDPAHPFSGTPPWLASGWVSCTYNQTGAIYSGPGNFRLAAQFSQFKTGSELGFRLDADRRELTIFHNREPQVVITDLPALSPVELRTAIPCPLQPPDTLQRAHEAGGPLPTITLGRLILSQNLSLKTVTLRGPQTQSINRVDLLRTMDPPLYQTIDFCVSIVTASCFALLFLVSIVECVRCLCAERHSHGGNRPWTHTSQVGVIFHILLPIPLGSRALGFYLEPSLSPPFSEQDWYDILLQAIPGYFFLLSFGLLALFWMLLVHGKTLFKIPVLLKRISFWGSAIVMAVALALVLPAAFLPKYSSVEQTFHRIEGTYAAAIDFCLSVCFAVYGGALLVQLRPKARPLPPPPRECDDSPDLGSVDGVGCYYKGLPDDDPTSTTPRPSPALPPAVDLTLPPLLVSPAASRVRRRVTVQALMCWGLFSLRWGLLVVLVWVPASAERWVLTMTCQRPAVAYQVCRGGKRALC
ncbi:hypothetical protein PAPYR_4214 [Paratrimastix pyriformis]|uniref:F-box domain-containing protein n=1 Tax=Paratrimastix pyriformis TaxID=342808 RepID=A0ABQ8UR32_9EUKA|nr:hypothetical protein PAPYR_4214 [Paratrimastix pyriformis]